MYSLWALLIFPCIFPALRCHRWSRCVKQLEEFSLCAWRCPPTCVNVHHMRTAGGKLCPRRFSCRVGCRCAAGYLRDEWQGKCVRIEDCSAHHECPPGQALDLDLQCTATSFDQIKVVSSLGNNTVYALNVDNQQ
ncbi:hypothetical protein JYU34_007736 [Plutella xylostella]|uniref:TIL domain-containing protein n=1 Tax=Plutella xylostella TaxID=51655 RepID=A0ABQ7QR38_PLUXY|nr:hypothetical protein JYU34_007736 [Plutella xylostella]